MLQWRTFQFYRFRHLRTFVLKLIVSMLGMTCAVQVVMWILPTAGRLIGMLELLVAALAGVGVVIAAIAGLNLLTYRELQHMPFGDKLYHFKKGRK